MLFTPYDIRDCLYDEVRTKRFEEAIKRTVKRGDIVADAGSGTGILALLALKHGAKKVYAIELSKRHIEVIRQNATLNNFQDKIIIIKGDAVK